MPIKTALIILAEGFEEIEALTPIDILRRGNVEVTVAGLTSDSIQGAHKITIQCDTLLLQCNTELFDAIILPGGMPGTLNLLESPVTQEILLKHYNNNKFCCAICAAPRVLDKVKLLVNRTYTCYPGTEKSIKSGVHQDLPVFKDGLIITGQSVGSAQAFSLEILKALQGEKTTQDVAEKIYYRH